MPKAARPWSADQPRSRPVKRRTARRGSRSRTAAKPLKRAAEKSERGRNRGTIIVRLRIARPCCITSATRAEARGDSDTASACHEQGDRQAIREAAEDISVPDVLALPILHDAVQALRERGRDVRVRVRLASAGATGDRATHRGCAWRRTRNVASEIGAPRNRAEPARTRGTSRSCSTS